jgi:P-type E1-E2 ATPase
LLTVQRSRVPETIAEKKRLTYQPNYCGDGANDLPMLNLAGLGIAFHAKATVKSFLVDFQSWSGWGFVPFRISTGILT